MVRETAACETYNCAAASVNDPASAAVTKNRSSRRLQSITQSYGIAKRCTRFMDAVRPTVVVWMPSTPLERPHRATSSHQLSAATATPRQRGTGIALMLASSASSQAGAALGAMAFPAIGPVGVVAIRQFVTALVLTPIVRPRLRGLRRDQWWPILGLVVVFSIMNLSLYAAIDRIGLALAVTLEFLGPLTVAITSSRRVLDMACAVLAGVGVVVLTNPGPTTDVIGIALALLAAAAWGCYILLNRTLGQRLPGLHGTAVASLVTAATWSRSRWPGSPSTPRRWRPSPSPSPAG